RSIPHQTAACAHGLGPTLMPMLRLQEFHPRTTLIHRFTGVTMLRRSILASFSVSLLLAACSGEETSTAGTPQAPSEPPPIPIAATALLDEAVDAMGMEFLTSITYSGEAWRARNGFMQTPSADPPWPLRDTITNYSRAIDLRDVTRPASRATGETFASNIF